MRCHVNCIMKILVIDDNKSITRVLDKFLKLKGHDCTTVNDGRNGLAMCMAQRFDVILLDLSMPEFSGLDFINTLAKKDNIYDHRIIVFTAMPLGTVNLENGAKGGIVQ